MAERNKQASVTMQDLLVSSLAQTDALAKMLIEKGADYLRRVMVKISCEERLTYRKLLNPTPQ